MVISSAANVIDDLSYNNVVKTILTLVTHNYGTECVTKLKYTRYSFLLIHGNNDNVFSSYCSSYVYKKGKRTKTSGFI